MACAIATRIYEILSQMRSLTSFFILPLILIGLAGCANQEILRKDGARSVRAFSPANLIKAEADMMAEINQREMLKGLKLLSEKLYRRNPRELKKSGLDTVEQANAQIFAPLPQWADSSVCPPDWQESFKLAFDEDYAGDRVHAFITALTSMLMASYDYKREIFLTDSLSAQKLYNSARNIEIAVWKLSNARLENGTKVLISNSMDGDVPNLSFEREFGKLIAQQDMLALLIEDKSNRSISRIFQNVATFIFFPI